MDDRENLGRQVVETANQISYGMGKAKMRQFFYPSEIAVFGVADNSRNLAKNIISNSLGKWASKAQSIR